MRKHTLAAAAFLLTLLIVACGERGSLAGPETADDQLSMVSPSFKAVHDAWSEPFVLDGYSDWMACANDGAGEWVDLAGFIDQYFRQITTPSGNVILQWKLDYYTADPASFTGQESGDVWQLVKAEDNGGSVTKPTGTQLVEHWQFNEFYMNQDGERIHNRVSWRLMWDAEGSVKWERLDIRCNAQ